MNKVLVTIKRNLISEIVQLIKNREYFKYIFKLLF